MRLAVLALAALAACVSPMDPTVPLAEPEVPAAPTEGVARRGWLLPGTTWRLAAIDGRRFPARVTVTWRPDGQIEGQAPCNRFFASYTGHWPNVSFDAVTATEIACDDLAYETAFLAAIARVTRGEHTDRGIRFVSPDGGTLDFVRL